jgi:hypothetical protein
VEDKLIISAIVGGLVSLGVALLKWLFNKTFKAFEDQQEEHSQKLDLLEKNSYTFATKRELTELKERDVSQLDQDIKKLGKAFDASMRVEIGSLRTEVREDIRALRHDSRSQSKDLTDRMDKLIELVASR